MKKLVISIVVLAALAFAYWTISPFFTNKVVFDELPESGSMSTMSVPVVPTPGHPAEGEVHVIHNDDGTVSVRYENYKTLNGPDLFLYLATDTQASEFVSLGRIRGTEGNITYNVPDDVDLAEYPFVLTWCRAFSTLFNYADLSPILPTEEPTNEVCIQVITPAQNPDTGEIVEFPTPCDVPDGWEPVQPEGLNLELEVN